jgi:hypothetical protein
VLFSVLMLILVPWHSWCLGLYTFFLIKISYFDLFFKPNLFLIQLQVHVTVIHMSDSQMGCSGPDSRLYKGLWSDKVDIQIWATSLKTLCLVLSLPFPYLCQLIFIQYYLSIFYW